MIKSKEIKIKVSVNLIIVFCHNKFLIIWTAILARPGSPIIRARVIAGP